MASKGWSWLFSNIPFKLIALIVIHELKFWRTIRTFLFSFSKSLIVSPLYHLRLEPFAWLRCFWAKILSLILAILIQPLCLWWFAITHSISWYLIFILMCLYEWIYVISFFLYIFFIEGVYLKHIVMYFFIHNLLLFKLKILSFLINSLIGFLNTFPLILNLFVHLSDLCLFLSDLQLLLSLF